METSQLYRLYLNADRLHKLCAKVGAKISSFHFPDENRVRSYLEDYFIDSTSIFYGEEALQEMREERERVIRELLDLVPESYVDRSDNIIIWYLDTTFGKISLRIGEALCERVKVGERRVEKIDPSYLVDAPKVTVVEEQYEWRCSDDIMGAMNHKQVTV